MKNNKIQIYSVYLSLLLFNGCVENPFFDNEITANERSKVSGRLLLNDNNNPDGVYIWFEGFNLSATADAQGNFEIELPPAQTQPGGGLNGIYSLYFYLANYRIKKIPLSIIKGGFQYETSFIDKDGNFTETVILLKLLDIKTDVSPNKIISNYTEDILISIKLDAGIDTVNVGTYKTNTGQTNCIIFRKKNALNTEAVFIRMPGTTYTHSFLTDKTEWQMLWKFSPGFFKPGDYEFIPYIIVEQEIPQQLLESIDEEVYAFDYHYLSLPFKQKTAWLYVSENDTT